MEHAAESDKGLGLAVVFTLLAVIGALVMAAGPSQMVMAVGFAAALTAGLLAVLVIHVYGA